MSLKEGESLRCPKCGKDTALWQEATASGWVDLDPAGNPGTTFERDGFDHQLEDNYGCGECNYESPSLRDFAVRLDRDGNEMPEPIPGQLTIEEAA